VLGFRRGWRPLPLPLVTLVVLALAGCGGGDDGETTASAPPSPQTTNQDDPAQARLPTGDGRGGVRLQKVGDFDQPVYVTQPPGEGRDLYVVEKTGRVQVVRDGQRVSKPFLDLSGQVSAGSEQGLLSLAFAPDYGKTGLLYVDYTDTAGDTRVVEYRRSSSAPLTADAGSAREVLRVDQPYENHNGGLVLFGPGAVLEEGRARDDLLYIGLGDGGSADDPQRNGQDLSTLLGKILRIDPRPSGGRPYSIPRSNPFLGRSNARPEIYSYGLRNPWRFSFDRQRGDLWIGDVGQGAFEEIDFRLRGAGLGVNFGWNAFEGRAAFPGGGPVRGRAPVGPVAQYSHGKGCSVTGGYVYRGSKVPALQGRYAFADYCTGRLWTMRAGPKPGGLREETGRLGVKLSNVTSFGEGLAGEVYVIANGALYRFARR
jgi:glucose/arabinose dehydrogenase